MSVFGLGPAQRWECCSEPMVKERAAMNEAEWNKGLSFLKEEKDLNEGTMIDGQNRNDMERSDQDKTPQTGNVSK